MKKYNFLMPLAGKASRFIEKGYVLPKSLIIVGNKQSIDWSLSSFKLDDCNLIFVIRKDHV